VGNWKVSDVPTAPIKPQKILSSHPLVVRFKGESESMARHEAALEELLTYGKMLETDKYLKHGACFRFRANCDYLYWDRCKEVMFRDLPNVPFCQSAEINPYLGGVARLYPKYPDYIVANKIIKICVREVFGMLQLEAIDRFRPWHVGTEIVRIDATSSVHGLPTPEGIHRDGDRFLAIMLLSRENVSGGESIIYDNSKIEMSRFTLRHPLDGVVFDDANTFHSVTPISCLAASGRASRLILGMSFNHYEDMERTPSLTAFE
jgi:hypothetical protein